MIRSVLTQASRSKIANEHPASSPLSIHDMTVAYHRKPVIWDIDYTAPIGKLVAIVGPNGAGKSTLISAVLDLVPKASGEVRVFGKEYRKQRSRVGYVPQRESVDWDFPVNALNVVAMGLYRKIGWCLPVLRRHRQWQWKHSTALAWPTMQNGKSTNSRAGNSSESFWRERSCKMRTCI